MAEKKTGAAKHSADYRDRKKAEAERLGYNAAFPNRVAYKHAHSQQNPEKDWGKHTLDAVRLAFYVLNERFGTDFTQGHGREAYDYWVRDKGTGRMLLPRLESVVFPDGFGTIQEFPNLTAAMERRGWTATRIRRVMGDNWVRIFREVWKG